MTPSAHRNPFPSISSMSLKVQKSPLIGNYRVLSSYPHTLEYWKCFNGFFCLSLTDTSASALKNTEIIQRRRKYKDNKHFSINRIHAASVLWFLFPLKTQPTKHAHHMYRQINCNIWISGAAIITLCWSAASSAQEVMKCLLTSSYWFLLHFPSPLCKLWYYFQPELSHHVG